ncbi:DUF4260 family protein [Roseovarius sp. ZX-A-9]|uniref:DUF4260 family protein n=1 Tax=Roseovarius sp. ZX-A-9 TaxID=3014783 RepID=UPI003FA7C54A
MVDYAFGPSVGTPLYNLAHTYTAPTLRDGLGLWAFSALLPVACVCQAHIGIERALRYGLKFETTFAH